MSNSRRNFLKFLGLVPAVAVATQVEAKPVEFTIEQAVAELEKGRTVKEGLPTSCCQTGATYLAITHGGIKPEGGPFLGYTPTREAALRMWLTQALLYVSSREGTIYWRCKPEIDCRIRSDGREDWMVYSRFVVSDGYEVFDTVDQLLHTKRVQPTHAGIFGAPTYE